MLRVMTDLLRLKNHPMVDYDWPTWQSGLVLLVLGVLAGLGSNYPHQIPKSLPLWIVSIFIIIFMYACLSQFIAWWMGMGGRWFGQGHMLNVLVAASAIDIISALLSLLGLPIAVSIAISIYSIWVKANALVGISNGRANLLYCIFGILLSIAPAVIIFLILMGGFTGSISLNQLPRTFYTVA